MSNQYPNDPYGRDPYGRDPYGQGPHRQDPTARYESYPPSQAYSAAGPHQPQPGQPSRKPAAPSINPTLFIGGVIMTGIVTGLAAWLGAWILRTIAEKINETGKLGVWNPLARDEYWFAVAAFLCALAAAALWYVLQIVTPSPDQFYSWTVGLLLAAAVIIPLLLSQGWEVGIATAIIHLVIGLPILTLIPTVGRKSYQ
ncbi:DUF6069 family protein [Gordonia sp. CPCC 205333]|uniref:DUF6069 family protein n=1 Tax=Gordonia sp. CPCC 205333 TaxID=3140790 RepID=UPI003AF3848F